MKGTWVFTIGCIPGNSKLVMAHCKMSMVVSSVYRKNFFVDAFLVHLSTDPEGTKRRGKSLFRLLLVVKKKKKKGQSIHYNTCKTIHELFQVWQSRKQRPTVNR